MPLGLRNPESCAFTPKIDREGWGGLHAKTIVGQVTQIVERKPISLRYCLTPLHHRFRIVLRMYASTPSS